MAMSAPWARMRSRTSATLPSPMKVRGSGLALFWVTTPRHSPPAVSSRSESSSMELSVAFSSGERPGALSPTSTARLMATSLIISLMCLLHRRLAAARCYPFLRTSTISPIYMVW